MAKDKLVPVFIPPLAAMLARAEELKGGPLSETEVERIRDKAPCITMKAEDAAKMTESRGYRDVNPRTPGPTGTDCAAIDRRVPSEDRPVHSRWEGLPQSVRSDPRGSGQRTRVAEAREADDRRVRGVGIPRKSIA